MTLKSTWNRKGEHLVHFDTFIEFLYLYQFSDGLHGLDIPHGGRNGATLMAATDKPKAHKSFGLTALLIREGVTAIAAYIESRDPDDPTTQTLDTVLTELRDDLNAAYPT